MEVDYAALDGFCGPLGYAHEGDAGFDLRSAQSLTLKPLERATVRCGFSIAIPEGHAGLVIPRSGLASKHGVTVLNAPGLVDCGYRGEVMVVLYNTDPDASFRIEKGDRIAQMAIVSMPQVDLKAVDGLDATERGMQGFGSSGTK